MAFYEDKPVAAFCIRKQRGFFSSMERAIEFDGAQAEMGAMNY